MIKTIQNTSKYSLDNFDLHFYFDQTYSSSSELYNDDGLTPNSYEKGAYELLTFNSKVSKNFLLITLNQKSGAHYVSKDKNITVKIHNIKPKKIFIDGKELVLKTIGSLLEIPITLKKEMNSEINIEF
jgi:oligosaccharide 4-alpha-D-glucosyltransferase